MATRVRRRPSGEPWRSVADTTHAGPRRGQQLPGGRSGSRSGVRESRAIEKQHRINEQIRITPVRVIAGDGEQLGIIPTDEALSRAREAGLDLVEVAPNEKPPVCRIMDFGKFKYQQKKKLHRTHVHQTKIKEIRLRPKTGEHDIDFKVNQAKGFLQHKDKVIVSVVFRGRELAHIDEGQRVMRMIIEQLDPVGKVDAPPQQMGRRLVCTLSPK
ncbi:MAG: translation initiation factor IF-3 [Planctomycetia bacterium]|nr:translation initiation factor IF-3 [Planctomycetia bacterium]